MSGQDWLSRLPLSHFWPIPAEPQGSPLKPCCPETPNLFPRVPHSCSIQRPPTNPEVPPPHRLAVVEPSWCP